MYAIRSYYAALHGGEPGVEALGGSRDGVHPHVVGQQVTVGVAAPRIGACSEFVGVGEPVAVGVDLGRVAVDVSDA